MALTVAEKLLDGAAPATLEALTVHRRHRLFAPGAELIGCDEQSPCLFHLFSGRAKSWRPMRDGRGLTLFLLGPGEVTCVISTVRELPGPAAITALTTVEAECWPAPLVRSLMRDDPRFATNMGRLTSERFAAIVERLADVSSGRVDQHLARALLRLAGEEGAWTDAPHVKVPLTRQELADLTNTTLHTASRTLSGWGEQGLIKSARGTVTVLDPHALAGIADFPE